MKTKDLKREGEQDRAMGRRQWEVYNMAQYQTYVTTHVYVISRGLKHWTKCYQGFSLSQVMKLSLPSIKFSARLTFFVSYFIFIGTYVVCLCIWCVFVRVCMCAIEHMWRSEDSPGCWSAPSTLFEIGLPLLLLSVPVKAQFPGRGTSGIHLSPPPPSHPRRVEITDMRTLDILTHFLLLL